MCETSVIETLAHADAVPRRIETDQRHEHDIKFAGAQSKLSRWFANSVRAPADLSGKYKETHARMPLADDTRQRDDAAPSSGELQQWRGIQFLRQGKIKTNAPARPQPAGLVDQPCKSVGSDFAGRSRNGATTGAQLATQGRAFATCGEEVFGHA
jgi:hypothetical protein